MFHRIEEALEDLKQGKVVIVCDDENRENEGDFIALAEYITPETWWERCSYFIWRKWFFKITRCAFLENSRDETNW